MKIISGTTKAWRVENLVAHGIKDKASYLSEAINNVMLVTSFLIAHFFMQSIMHEYITPHAEQYELRYFHT